MYWLVSLPLLESQERTWTLLQNKTTYEHDMSSNFKFEVPELRVGTLDSLMVLSDDLVKVNSMVEAVVNKVRRQLFDIGSGRSEDTTEVNVEGLPPDTYIERFTWNAAKYPPRRPLADTVRAISDTTAKLEDDLKVRVSEFNTVKQQLSALNRKATGSLAVRDLGGLVDPQGVVATENLVTLFVVVPKSAKGEWLAGYEKLTDYVVPRSSKLVTDDAENCLFSVTLFRRVVESFRTAARAKGFQVREHEASEDASARAAEVSQKLKRDSEAKRSQMEEWSAQAYGEAFSAWIHICAIRLFVESILRYGLPPQFQAVLMKPQPKATGKLRKLLASTFASQGSKQYFDGETGTAAGEAEMFPYVSFSVSVEG